MKIRGLIVAASVLVLAGCNIQPAPMASGPQLCRVQDPPDLNTDALDRAIQEEEFAAMGIMADVSFCQHDPGHNPNWQYWKDLKLVPIECPGGHIDQTCQQAANAEYDQFLKMYDDDYRRGVCACWAEYPSNSLADTIARASCIAGEMYDFSWNMNAFYNYYTAACLADCDCVQE